MKKQVIIMLMPAFLFLASCNSVQKSVDPTGQGPVPRGSGLDVDADTIKAPKSDTL